MAARGARTAGVALRRREGGQEKHQQQMAEWEAQQKQADAKDKKDKKDKKGFGQ